MATFKGSFIPINNISHTMGESMLVPLFLSSIHIHFLKLLSLYIHSYIYISPQQRFYTALCSAEECVSIGNADHLHTQHKLKYFSKIMKAQCNSGKRDKHPFAKDNL